MEERHIAIHWNYALDALFARSYRWYMTDLGYDKNAWPAATEASAQKYGDTESVRERERAIYINTSQNKKS